ncbi:putative phosphoenolpyruvate synthase [Uloborus diversus]|uniref:putative phosphoenolpyruvate synthase n=1 Tax=Uloborus diversus TaxID=327109 RepID=UPI00240A278E|nr:putative phosphoenolpyruvate synthase [Uloborus diversus]
MLPITKINLSIDKSNATEETTEIRASFTAHHLYELSGCEVPGGLKTSSGSTSINPFTFYLNGKKGSGICLKEHIKNVGSTKAKHVANFGKTKDRPLVVPFSDVTCQDSELTGGKGSSLGKLTALSQDLKSFVVPNGVVVTTAAYETFLTKNITDGVRGLEAVLYGQIKGDVKEACKRLCDAVANEKIPEDLKESILKSLNKSFGQKMHSCKFAVRSSATGEDTEQMSAAGQMDTFLGISGIDEVLLAVKKCWASQFGFVATEYKRRYGQELNSPMAVVIQQMVPCDVAGVMFTCDPLTGNPTLMSITANYGLGESVVSGSEEPDAIELGRDYYDQLTIRNKSIGAKSRKIVVKDGEGTAVEDVSDNQRNECCLSDEMIFRLGKIGVQIEKHYRTKRDVEFGFWNNNLYIFQSRPVTSGSQELDFEIENEFDGPLRIENDFFSFANTAEVLPGSMSPFGYDTFFRMFNPIWQSGKKTEWQSDVSVRYFPVCWLTTKLHTMFNVADLFRGMHNEDSNPINKATMVAFMGRLLDDPELFEVSEERYAYSTTKEWPWMKTKRLLECMFFSGMHLKRAQAFYPKYRIPVEECKTAKEALKVMSEHCSDLTEAMIAHLICSQGSSMWNMLVLTTLAEAKGEVDDSVYRDFSTLVKTSSDVESADVPSAIQSLAFHISRSIKPEEFQKMQVEEALQWLLGSSSSAGQKFRYFLEKHGHRCVKEFDIASTTWGSDPKPLVKLLQGLAAHVSKDASPKETEGFEALSSKLSTQLGILTKLKLRFFLHMGWKGVQQRENTKSLLVKGTDAWRQGYNHLAKLMVAEGRIPDERIMYFMTLEDVRELLKTRSPRVLAKARHRQRLHPKMDKYMFPETFKGVPKPITFEDEILVNGTEESFTMKGIPVSQGVAKGYVRVALTLEDATHIKPGEILLAYSTDIGWTPYFPMLAGCITELGGLISHGAVVSREYGLPCVAGVHGATRRFQSGDYILLDGNKGEVTKLPPPEAKTS